MDRKMFNTERSISWLCIPPVLNSAEQSSSGNVCHSPAPVEFVIAAIKST